MNTTNISTPDGETDIEIDVPDTPTTTGIWWGKNDEGDLELVHEMAASRDKSPTGYMREASITMAELDQILLEHDIAFRNRRNRIAWLRQAVLDKLRAEDQV